MAKDAALSRRRHGFDSRWEYHLPLGSSGSRGFFVFSAWGCAYILCGFLSHSMAHDILAVLPEVMAVLPRDEEDAVLSDLPRMT